MTSKDLAAALAALPDGANVTITVAKADLMRALTPRAGDEAIDTTAAAARFGYTPDRWRRWCADGLIEGAWQDADGGPWHLPAAACERFLAQRKRAGASRKRRARHGTPRGPRAKRSDVLSPAPTTDTAGSGRGVLRAL
jgi:hypothetical protein